MLVKSAPSDESERRRCIVADLSIGIGQPATFPGRSLQPSLQNMGDCLCEHRLRRRNALKRRAAKHFSENLYFRQLKIGRKTCHAQRRETGDLVPQMGLTLGPKGVQRRISSCRHSRITCDRVMRHAEVSRIALAPPSIGNTVTLTWSQDIRDLQVVSSSGRKKRLPRERGNLP